MIYDCLVVIALNKQIPLGRMLKINELDSSTSQTATKFLLSVKSKQPFTSDNAKQVFVIEKFKGTSLNSVSFTLNKPEIILDGNNYSVATLYEHIKNAHNTTIGWAAKKWVLMVLKYYFTSDLQYRIGRFGVTQWL